MGIVIDRVIKANKREVPPSMPVGAWWDIVAEYAESDWVDAIPWFSPELELVSPAEARRLRAKAVVWFEVTGEWPEDIAWWWEVRMARRRNDIPHTDEMALATITADGTLVCGKCGARWSANRDGGSHPTRCKLCDRSWLVIRDEREETDGSEDHET